LLAVLASVVVAGAADDGVFGLPRQVRRVAVDDVASASFGAVVTIGGELDIATVPEVRAALATRAVAEAAETVARQG
jgi:hypothetical protein